MQNPCETKDDIVVKGGDELGNREYVIVDGSGSPEELELTPTFSHANEIYKLCIIIYVDSANADPTTADTYSTISTNPDVNDQALFGADGYAILDEIFEEDPAGVKGDRYFDSSTGTAKIVLDSVPIKYCDENDAGWQASHICTGNTFHNWQLTLAFVGVLKARPSQTATDDVIVTLKSSCKDYRQTFP